MKSKPGPNWTHLQMTKKGKKKKKIDVNGKTEIQFGKGRPAIFPFPTMFSKALCFRVIKSQNHVVND